MKWLMSVVRIVGSQVPFVSALVQLQAEVDSLAIQRRLQVLEDPISALHPDIRSVSEQLYKELVKTGSAKVTFDRSFYSQFSRPLAMLEAQGFVEGVHAIGGQYVDGLWIQAPPYFVYLCALFEDQHKMDALVKTVEDCAQWQWLDGKAIASDLQLPTPVVKAIFLLYEAKGLGICSRESGVVKFQSRT